MKKQRGLTLLEVIASLAILSAGVIGMAQLTSRYSNDVKNSIVADQVKRVADAARASIKDNYTTISGVATSTSPYLITVNSLVTGGYLTTGTSATNGYGQSTCVLVLQPSANNLQALVITEGGTTIDDVTLGSIAALAGGAAGAVRAATPTQITGTLGGWSIPVSTYHNLVNNQGKKCDGTTAGNVQVTAGHPAVALWFENGSYQSGMLYRDSIPGKPELNTMNTPILMSAVQTSGAACTSTGAIGRDINGALVSCQGGQWKSQGSAYWGDPVTNFASLPACNAAATGITRVVSTPTTGTGPRPYTCDGSTWKALAVDDSGNLTLPGILAAGKVLLNDVVTAGTACPSNGLVAKDSTGLILSCQSGVWVGQGVGSGQTWQNMLGVASSCSGPRAAGVVCTNTSGRPIKVSGINCPSGNFWGYQDFYLEIDALIVGRIRQWAETEVNCLHISEIVPNGSTYRFTVNVGVVAYWSELR